VEYVDQKVSPAVGYNWRDWTAEASWVNAHRRFPSRIYDQFEYDNNVITGKLFRTLAPNFRGLIQYDFGHYDYDFDVTRPGRYHQIRGGLAGKLSERTSLSTRVGYMDRSYSQDRFTEFDKPVADVQLQHQLTKRTGLDFYFHRTSHESSFTNNRFLDEKLIQISGNHLFTPKFRGRTGTVLTRRDFDGTAAVGRVVVKRRDLSVAAFVGADYVLRPWLMFNLDYRYEKKNSNVSDFDFRDNILSLGMTLPL
jgi:hypothetical protein